MEEHTTVNEQYTFTSKAKRLTFILMGIGIIGLILGAVQGHDDHYNRFFGNILTNSFFFMSISLAAAFFVAVQYASEAAWGIVLKRVFEAVMAFLPIGAVCIVLILLLGQFHVHGIYHWMHAEVYDIANVEFDELITHKQPYFSTIFFWARTLLFLGGYIWAARILRRRSLEEDRVSGTQLYFKNRITSAGFLVFFGFTSVVASWDWLMSIDTHWFSTLYGWYVFSGMWVSAITVFVLLTLHLKRRGYLENVNENHLHDLGKWMFAIALLWCYLWFSQYMLIWYSNIPEEVTYYQTRINEYGCIFYTMFFVNFLTPFLLLMARDAKRNTAYLTVGAIVLFIFHWIDVYLLVIPGATKATAGFGIMEIMLFLGFLGVFLYVVLNSLTKASVQVKHHPFLEESLHHEI